MVSNNDMSGARHEQLKMGECLGLKQVQHITMHNQDFSEKGRAIKGLSDGRMDALHRNRQTRSMFQCIEPEATQSPRLRSRNHTKFLSENKG